MILPELGQSEWFISPHKNLPFKVWVESKTHRTFKNFLGKNALHNEVYPGMQPDWGELVSQSFPSF